MQADSWHYVMECHATDLLQERDSPGRSRDHAAIVQESILEGKSNIGVRLRGIHEYNWTESSIQTALAVRRLQVQVHTVPPTLFRRTSVSGPRFSSTFPLGSRSVSAFFLHFLRFKRFLHSLHSILDIIGLYTTTVYVY